MSDTPPPLVPPEQCAQDTARALVAKWEHGSEEHRQWLRDIAIPDIAAALLDASKCDPTAQQEIATLRKRVAELEGADEWQPADTIPKDQVLDIWIANSDGGIRWIDCYYDAHSDQWRSRKGGHRIFVHAKFVRYWRPCPSAPAAAFPEPPHA